MRALILGVGDAFTACHFGSSALIEAPDGYVLVDCPDPIHRVLREATTRAGWTAGVDDIHDVILTHLHGDHSNGLESFGFWRYFRRLHHGVEQKPRLHATQLVIDRLWEKLAPAMDGRTGAQPRTLDDFFEIHTLDPDSVAAIVGLEVRCRFTGHPIPTVGLLLSDGSATLGWSSDTPFEQQHVDWLAQADIIVHESNLGAAHTPIESLEALPDEVKQRIRLIHVPDDFDSTTTSMTVLIEGDVLNL